jgi:hypothetical protein
MIFSHDTETIPNAFFKAFESALANYEAVAVLSKQGFISQATSLAILSLEEIGKMFLLDGLLFAKMVTNEIKVICKDIYLIGLNWMLWNYFRYF